MPRRVEVTWRGAKVRAEERAAAASGLADAVEHLLGESQQIVPHETGDLERSGRAQVDRANLVGVVSYDTEYAVRQHEELTWRHNPGRQAKYLEEPFYRERDTMLELVAAKIRRALR